MAYDITNTLNKLIQNSEQLDRNMQFDFLKEMAFLKMRILEGLPTFLQLSGYQLG
jgi:replication factor C subunit 2/4